jgi:hypothetical protein
MRRWGIEPYDNPDEFPPDDSRDNLEEFGSDEPDQTLVDKIDGAFVDDAEDDGAFYENDSEEPDVEEL